MGADLRDWAQRHPENVALEIGPMALRYGELEAEVNRLARVFRAHGLVRGDHVAALLSNSAFPLIVAWAAWRCGLYFTPVSTALSAPDAAYIIGDCQAKLVIVDGRFASEAAGLRQRLPGLPHWLSHGPGIQGFDAVEAAMAQALALPVDAESPGALMLYTSGTTGAPKGVWRALPDTGWRGAPPFAADLIALFDLDDQARYLSTAPLYHAAPLRFALATLSAGGRVHALDKFEPEAALHALAAEGITHSQWVPTMFQRLLQLPAALRAEFEAPLHSVALHAAAPCPEPVKRAMIDWWGPILLEYYSGTEGVGLTMIDSHEWLARPGSVGRAVKGVPHVADAAGRELPAGATGQIYFSGVAPFRYFGDAEKTARGTHALGWQTLGDIGHLDADGYLFLTDRMDDMIISGGVNVYPQEIEAAILELPEVADCAVLGVTDAAFGERPVAIVVGRAGVSNDALVSLVLAHCRRRLGRIKCPERCVATDSIPRTAAGKLVRRDLRAWLDRLAGPC